MEEPEAVYTYTDEEGLPLFEVVRFPGKRFKQREYGYDNWGLNGVRRVPYNLVEVVRHRGKRWIWLTEGEKDADRICKAGGIGTTTPGGAAAWRPEYAGFFAGAHVRVVADRDAPGRDYAERAAKDLQSAGARVVIVQAKEGKDAHDHLEAGWGLEDFQPYLVGGVQRPADILRAIRDQPIRAPNAVGALQQPFYAGRLYVLGGYTGEGKTSLALQHALEAAATAPTVFVSLEMPLREVAIRAASIILRKPTASIDVDDAIDALDPLQLTFKETTTIEEVESVIRTRTYDLVVIDHLHHVIYQDRFGLAARAKLVHNWCRQYDLPILMLVQLTENRVMGKSFTRPTLSSVRDAADISHVGDLVQLIYRPRNEDGLRGGEAELLTVKNRYGQESVEKLWFDGETHRFGPDMGWSSPI